MDHSNQRDQLREFYYNSWKKHQQQKQQLSPLEQQIVAIIKEHPEYHKVLEDKETCLNATYLPEMGDTNPFLHLSMHIGLREQVQTDRPAGIAELYQRLVAQKGIHEAEHAMMECLGEMIWRAQQTQKLPDELTYLDCLGKIK